MNKPKPFKAWLLWDLQGTYSPILHITRREAEADRLEHDYTDAKWRIVRATITPASTSREDV